jgi:hypothetical protein
MSKGKEWQSDLRVLSLGIIYGVHGNQILYFRSPLIFSPLTHAKGKTCFLIYIISERYIARTEQDWSPAYVEGYYIREWRIGTYSTAEKQVRALAKYVVGGKWDSTFGRGWDSTFGRGRFSRQTGKSPLPFADVGCQVLLLEKDLLENLNPEGAPTTRELRLVRKAFGY